MADDVVTSAALLLIDIAHDLDEMAQGSRDQFDVLCEERQCELAIRQRERAIALHDAAHLLRTKAFSIQVNNDDTAPK